jgi:hypothetical protein
MLRLASTVDTCGQAGSNPDMTQRPRFRQIVDGRAALLAGLFAGAALFLLLMALTAAFVGSPWVFPRMAAAIVMGRSVLPPPATFDPVVFAVAFVVHMVLSLAYAALFAFILHRGGLVLGILGGALLGLGLYAINYFTFAAFFPWFLDLRSGIVLRGHVLFGALAGGIYELLEVERFVRVEGAPPAPAAAPEAR